MVSGRLNFFLCWFLLGSAGFSSAVAIGYAEPATPSWGFFGHRRINRLAVFSLPMEMALFYKKNLEYITEHAVDPDKRRYASPFEASRHFMDLDRYGSPPFAELPRSWADACARLTDIYIRTPTADSVFLFGYEQTSLRAGRYYFCDTARQGAAWWPADGISAADYHRWFATTLFLQYFEERKEVPCDSLQVLFEGRLPCQTVWAVDTFSAHGILPYHLAGMEKRLQAAFASGDAPLILRLSAEIGHYVADAHVPLHTTANYNGQLTGQYGIHAFWESRIPELFADARYQYLVGAAHYVANPAEYYWDIVLDSHQWVDRVLDTERVLRRTFPPDQQYSLERRGGTAVRTQSPGFAYAYEQALDGLVEQRMRQAVRAVASTWYTAWTDAGQPDLSKLKIGRHSGRRDSEKRAPPGSGFGRPHE